MRYKNSYDLLRHILATLVIITHSFYLTGNPNEPLFVISKGQTHLGELAVMGFFSISGYLITASFDKSSNVLLYFCNRALRIFPAFIVCLIITAFGIAPIMYYLNYQTFTGFPVEGDNSATSYILNNSLLKVRQWSIDGVLDGVFYKGSLNGSLWSISAEWSCYIITAVLGLFGSFKQNRQLIVLAVLFLYTFYLLDLAGISYGPTLFTLQKHKEVYICYFIGTLLYLFQDQIEIDFKGLLFVVFVSLLLIRFGGFQLIAPVSISLVCIFGFSKFQFSVHNDISYGMYIYSFPCQQLIYAFFKGSLNIWIFAILSLSVSVVLAFFSSKYIETPFLKIKRLINSLTIPKSNWVKPLKLGKRQY